MDVSPSVVLVALMAKFSLDEVENISSELAIDFDSLTGKTKGSKALALVSRAVTSNKLNKLVEIIQRERPDAFGSTELAQKTDTEDSQLENFNSELVNLRKQVVDLQKASLTENQLEQRIQEILKTADRAAGQGELLTARVILPRQEDMNVRLIPSHSFERLEEYRSDENIAYLLIGVFAGGICGILSNWAANESLVITRFSLVLMCFLAVLTIACVLWVRIIRSRTNAVKGQILSNSK